jgi:uncharacterized protein (TIGR03435 family)
MERKLISLCCVIVMTAVAANAQTAAQSPTKLSPLPPGAMQVPAPPSPEEQRLAAQIAAYATAQCGGKGSDAAPDCRIKILWAATQCPDQVTAQSTDAKTETARCKVPDGGFEYEVSSIKMHKDDPNNGSMIGPTADGYRWMNVTMRDIVRNAYSTGLQLQITGTPGWIDDLHFDVESKFVPEVGEALKKLIRDDRFFVQRYMMQQLLKERMNFAAHVDTKEVASYDLVVGKNGPKLKVSDPTAKDNGTMMMRMDQGKMVITGKGMPISQLARNLSGPAGRPVFDKTGLTGMYNVTLEYTREPNLSASAPGESPSGTAVVTPSDPAGPSILAAVEDQLGLKLVSSRGPMMVVVIEHMDKPAAN